MTGDAQERIQITLAGCANDVRRQGRRRSFAIPATRATLVIEIVAKRLLVEARLRSPRRVMLGWPEARAVGREHFIDQRDATIAIATELELGVGDDDSAIRGDGAATFVDE